MTSEETFYNPCKKSPTKCPKKDQTEQNFIQSTSYQVQWNLQKFTSTNIYSLTDRNERLALNRSADTFFSAAFEGRLSTLYRR